MRSFPPSTVPLVFYFSQSLAKSNMFRRATALMTVAALFAIPALFVPWYRACAPVENSRERTTQCAELVPLAVGQATFAAPWPLALLAVLPIAFAAAAHAVNFADTQLEVDVCVPNAYLTLQGKNVRNGKLTPQNTHTHTHTHKKKKKYQRHSSGAPIIQDVRWPYLRASPHLSRER